MCEAVRSGSVGFLMNRMAGDLSWTAAVTFFHIGSVSHQSWSPLKVAFLITVQAGGLAPCITIIHYALQCRAVLQEHTGNLLQSILHVGVKVLRLSYHSFLSGERSICDESLFEGFLL